MAHRCAVLLRERANRSGAIRAGASRITGGFWSAMTAARARGYGLTAMTTAW
jgi:hypothetical protein